MLEVDEPHVVVAGDGDVGDRDPASRAAAGGGRDEGRRRNGDGDPQARHHGQRVVKRLWNGAGKGLPARSVTEVVTVTQ